MYPAAHEKNFIITGAVARARTGLKQKKPISVRRCHVSCKMKSSLSPYTRGYRTGERRTWLTVE